MVAINNLGYENCVPLDYNVESSGSFLLTFRDKVSAPYSGEVSPEDGTDKLSRNVGKKLPLLDV
jgi:hypothetical protein